MQMEMPMVTTTSPQAIPEQFPNHNESGDDTTGCRLRILRNSPTTTPRQPLNNSKATPQQQWQCNWRG